MDPDSKRLRFAVTDGRGAAVRASGLTRWLARVAPARARGEVAIALVTEAHMRALNRQYRRQDRPTDVLSFPVAATRVSPTPDPGPSTGSGPSRAKPRDGSRTPDTRQLGDIVIATGVARRQAREAGHSYDTELRILALHGLLHLLGYDHESPADRGRMARTEAKLRRDGGLREGLIERQPPQPARKRLPPASARERGWGPATTKE